MSALDGLAVTVAGLGPMGRGIARAFADAGAAVTVVDASREATQTGLERIREEAAKDAERGARKATSGGAGAGDGASRPGARGAGATAVPAIRAADSIADAVGEADLFIEAIVERPDAKAALLEQVRAAARPELVVASNTSSLSIGELGQAYGAPEHVIGMHFFNPVARMRLVEVVRGPHTDDGVRERTCEWVRALGKTPVVCVDAPNFVVNRVCRPLYYEAQLLATQGVEPAVVDAVARGALGHRMGPLELLDFTGLHTHLGSSETALREFGDPRYRPIPRTRALVRAGATGRAAGRGWYDHEAEPPRAARARVVREQPQRDGRSIALSGPGTAALLRHPTIADLSDGSAHLAVYSAPSSCTREDVAAVRGLLARGLETVVDSSHHGWLEALPRGASWIRLHVLRGDPFAEVVADPEAALTPGPAVDALLDAVGAAAVQVPALPGLVADRLQHTLVNEAVTVVEEGTASAGDVDLALKLGMNHPAGPLEHLTEVGERTVLQSLRSMQDGFGDPRYRPAPLLVRRAAGAARRAAASAHDPADLGPVPAEATLRLPT